MSILWGKLLEQRTVSEKIYLLYVLYFFKNYDNEHICCSMGGGCDKKTFRKYLWKTVEDISLLFPRLVS